MEVKKEVTNSVTRGRILRSLFIAFLWLISAGLFQAQAKVVQRDHAQVRLISETVFQTQGRVRLGVHYKLDPEWHIYWKNPGDSGAAPKFELSGGQIVNIDWPYPKRIPVSNLTNFGYEEEAVVFLDVNFTEGPKLLDLEWLVCQVECIPGFATFDLQKDTVTVEPELFQKFTDLLPVSSTDWTFDFVSQNEKTFDFQISPPTGQTLSQIKNLFVFPDDGNNFGTKTPKSQITEESLLLQVPRSANARPQTTVHSFTVVVQDESDRWTALEATIAQDVSSESFLWGLLLALMGGLILNLMPCVFPVIFLKGYGFLKDPDKSKVRRSSWLYTVGVLLSFAVIGGVLLILRSLGHSIGWGFQLQNLYVLGFLILLFVVMALSFLDIVSFEKILPSSISRVSNSKWFSGDVGTGVLAVIVASPCTAPFMGTALGLTLLLSPIESLFIFLCLGLGLALPVPLLAHWPWLIERLPKSGPWLVKLKKAMSIPLLLTAVWLIWVFVQSATPTQDHFSENWHSFEPTKIKIEKQQRSVFVDFTAAWCITCQVNKQAVLNTAEIQQLFEKHNVYLVRADWTNHNPKITKALARFQRNSVPLYVFYEKGNESPIILNELLTKKDIQKLFKREDPL